MVKAPSGPLTAERSNGPSALTCAPEIGRPVAASETVPATVPTETRGAAVTAASASSRPSPQTLLFSALPPQPVSGVSRAVRSSSEIVPVTSPTRDGVAADTSATVPAVCGEAMDEPLSEAYPPPGTEERTFTPGAATSGLMRPSGPAPRLDSEAIALL